MASNTQWVNPYAEDAAEVEDVTPVEPEFVNPYEAEAEPAPEIASSTDELDPLAPAYDVPLAPVQGEKSTATIGSLLSDIGTAASELPTQIAGATASAIEGSDPVDVFGDKDWKDEAIEKARISAMNSRIESGGEDPYVDFLGIKITRNDVRNFSQSASFSLVSLGASISGAALAAPVPIPGARIAAAASAGGFAGYRMDTNNVLRDLREGMDTEAKQQMGRTLTDKEFIAIAQSPEMQEAASQYGLTWGGKGNITDLVQEHGLHEAGWEAVGNVIMLGAGKSLFKLAQKSGILKPLLTAVGGTAGEIASETETQIGQHNVELELGLNPEGKERSYLSLEDQAESAKEVAGSTILLVGGLGAGAYGAGKINKRLRGKTNKDTISADELGDVPRETPESLYEGGVDFESGLNEQKEASEKQPFQEGEPGIDFESPEQTGGLGLVEPGAEQAETEQYDNAIDYTVDLLGGSTLTAETTADADKRVAQDGRIAEQEEKLKGVTFPEGFDDNRLKRLEFRDRAKIALDEMIEGGGIDVIPDPNFVVGESDKPGEAPQIRTSSQNPDWVQSILSDTGMTVEQVKRAVNKALKGDTLGVRQGAAVQGVLDQVSDQRTGDEAGNLDYAKQQLEKARALRSRYTQGAFAESTDDWLYQDIDYHEESDAEGRLIYELLNEAKIYGDEAENQAMQIAEKNIPDRVVLAELSSLIREYNGYDQQEYQQVAGVDSTQALPGQPQEGALPDQAQLGAGEFGGQPPTGQQLGPIESQQVAPIDEGFMPEPEIDEVTEQQDVDDIVEQALAEEQKEEFIKPDVQGVPAAAFKGEKETKGIPESALKKQKTKKEAVPKGIPKAAIKEKRKTKSEGKRERRDNDKARKLYSKMSHEELLTALLTHELTGIKGRRSFVVEVEDADNVISIDADSLKWFNDTMSPESGDKLLQAIADVLVDEIGDAAYHISGDEFYGLDTGQGINEVEAGVKAAQARLKDTIIKIEKQDGTIITKTGIEFTYGIGKTKNEADYALKQEKINKEKQGLRAAREQEPSGVVIEPAKGKQDNKRESAEEEIKGTPEAALKKDENYKKAKEKLKEKADKKRAELKKEKTTPEAAKQTESTKSDAQDVVNKEKPKSKPLNEIKVTIQAQVEGSNELVEITRPADVELSELDGRLNDLKQLLDCLT